MREERESSDVPSGSSLSQFCSPRMAYISHGGLTKGRRRAPGRGACCASFIIDPLPFVHSFTAQLPRGMQVQRNPPAQQLQRL